MHPLPFVSGVLFLVSGFFFLLDRLGLLNLDERLVVPVILVAAGVWILLSGRDRHSSEPPPPPAPEPPPAPARSPDEPTTAPL